MRVAGHAALVTGGGSGLGAATARALAKAGAKVALLDINEAAAKAVAAEIGGTAVRCDVADAASAEGAVAAARAAHGPARILINCAGIGVAQRIVGRDGPMPLADFKRVIDINLIGSFNLMRLAASDMMPLPALEDGERGVIVSTASVAAFEGQIGQAAYSASKGGIVSLTLPAAREFARAGIAVAQRIVGRDGPMKLADFKRVIDINLIGSFNLMRLAAAEMMPLVPLDEGERGVIVSTASVAAYEGQIGQAAYSASKGGIVSLTLPAAREFAGSGIRVNAIAPGLFQTPMLAGLPQAAQASLGASVPFPARLGRPEEYARLVMDIIANPMLNGATIRLDCALRMAPR
jgi:NAD(P)-dependent dehydrogenase (short-subunit alcohol dehydrogenase family)